MGGWAGQLGGILKVRLGLKKKKIVGRDRDTEK